MRSTGFARQIAITAAAVVAFISVAGCPVTPPPGEEAPTLPPLSTFVLNFDDFDSGDSSVMGAAPGSTSQVRSRAAFQVGVWQTILTVSLAVPVAALGESFNHTPTWQPDGSWVWAYEFRSQGQLHSAELQARVVNTDVQWDMYISREGAFDNVHWFTGRTGILQRSGTWTVNRDPNEVIPFVRIDYEFDGANSDLGEVRYTSIEEGGELFDSYIVHAVTNGVEYDRAYTIYIAEDENLVEIEWDRLMQDGRAREPVFYGDNDWRCWDETLADRACPAGG